jgi:hypothetical protein
MERKIIICWAAVATGLLLINTVILFRTLKVAQISAGGLGEIGVKTLSISGEIREELKKVFKIISASADREQNDFSGSPTSQPIRKSYKESNLLTGIWSCNDGGTYYIKTDGNEIYWVGESGDNGKSWTNLFVGKIDGMRINGKWHDFPKGKNRLNGILSLQVSTDQLSLTYLNGTGGFSGRSWTKVNPQSATNSQ